MTDATSLSILRQLERKVLWLSSWMIHNANHLRHNDDGLKVGGHQASSASMSTIMTALYFAALRAQDRVAVKPHASPIFHAPAFRSSASACDRRPRNGASWSPKAQGSWCRANGGSHCFRVWR